MVNHNAKMIKDHLDLASKLIFQTSDGNFVGQNALSSIETGDILIFNPNNGGSPLTQINNGSHDIGTMQNFMNQWMAVGNQGVNVSESQMGATPPSGTAWRQTEALLQESRSLFELMTENKGLAIEEMMREFIIPYLKKQMDNKDEVMAILDDYQIKQVDSAYVPREVVKRANKKVKMDILSKSPEDIISGNLMTPEMQAGMMAEEQMSIQSELNSYGNQRPFKPDEMDEKTWKQALKDLEWDLEVDVTSEAKDSQNIMATLTTVLQTIASNPMILQDPNAKLLFNRIIETAGGISPIEINQAN
jgi:hypothetical protein